jgi:ribosomal protein S6--L-glutamate ligase
MRIAIFIKAKNSDTTVPHISEVTNNIIASLRRAGTEVDTIVAESRVWDISRIRCEYDLYVLKSNTQLTQSIAGILSAKGAHIVNSVESTQLAKDKISTVAALSAHGISVPASWSTGQGRVLRPLLDEGSLWLKESGGSNGKGVFRLTAESNWIAQQNPVDCHGLPKPLFAQREVTTPGYDLKVYVVGARVWAITRPWPARNAREKDGKPAILDVELHASALACGKALGLEIYGVDYLMSENGNYVVDVNAFPGFKGVTEGPHEIAQYLLRYK